MSNHQERHRIRPAGLQRFSSIAPQRLSGDASHFKAIVENAGYESCTHIDPRIRPQPGPQFALLRCLAFAGRNKAHRNESGSKVQGHWPKV